MQFSEVHVASRILLLLLLLSKSFVSPELLSNLEHKVLTGISVPPVKPPNPLGHCLRYQCRYLCFNGKSSNIVRDVNSADSGECQYIEELHLYNYYFSSHIIPKAFLGDIADKVKFISVYASDVMHIDSGAFDSATLTGIRLENLQLTNVHKGIFENISEKFVSFTLIQRNPSLQYVDKSFLDYIKYQIKKLTIQTGLLTVKNLTNSDCLLNSLEEVNLSHNSFEGRLTASSFQQLSMVETLNLTHSEISYLPESIFSDIIGTLRSLDLSNNKLKVISQDVFGWRELRKGLYIYLSGNPWECTCELRTDMVKILAYQSEKVYCEIPKGIIVTDEALCMSSELGNDTSCSEADRSECTGSSGGGFASNSPTLMTSESSRTTELTTEFDIGTVLPTTDPNGLVQLECEKEKGSSDMDKFSILWPSVQFHLTEMEGFKVEIEITEVASSLNGTYGVLWFSKVTTQYYKMEVNYNEFGLGCYGLRHYVTVVENLLPDMSYTFCLVLKDQRTVSPFSCKSVYIGGNLEVKYNAWLTRDMKATGITLVVLGIVLFKFLGILCVFILIKQKPTLVKGSKRVATQKKNSSKIIVFPEDTTLQKFELMEEQLAKQSSKGSMIRRSSSVSVASYDSTQSYMNPVNSNLYEIIPAYQRYLSAHGGEYGVDVSYAEIPFKRKRTSNDPLPAVPTVSKPTTPVLLFREEEKDKEYYFITDDTNV